MTRQAANCPPVEVAVFATRARCLIVQDADPIS